MLLPPVDCLHRDVGEPGQGVAADSSVEALHELRVLAVVHRALGGGGLDGHPASGVRDITNCLCVFLSRRKRR